MKKKQSTLLGYMAIDQHGNRYKIVKNPLKELLEHFNSEHADKMYIDVICTKDSEESINSLTPLTPEAKHIGYIICGHWLTVYEVHEWIGSRS